MVGRLAAIVAELLQFLRSPPPPHREEPYARLRNMIGDILAEGRRKSLIHLLLRVDITQMRRGCAEASITACVAKAFADAIDEDRRVQGYRRGSSRLVVFDEVDICFMVEREVEGATLPMRCIVRAANRKSAGEIHADLQAAKSGKGGLSKMERGFFDLPTPVRRFFWGLVRRNPALTKELMGTVGLTSMGMFGTGSAVVLPIAPMTLTLSIGTVDTIPALVDGHLVEREVIHLNLTADHDVVDGAPLMRFAERLRQKLEQK